MNINVKELKEKLESGEKFVFIDVREQHEFDEFNLGAQLIPLGNVAGEIENLAKHSEEEVVVHCRSGARSGMAQQLMQQAGFKNVRNLEGGVMAWISAGYEQPA